MKITRNTTVEQLKSFIGANVSEVKKQDKNLFDRISYTDKAMKKDPKAVKKADLVDLAKDITKLLGDAVKEAVATPTLTPVAENSVKPVAKLSAKGGKKSAEKTEDKTESKEETPVTTEKDSEKKSEKTEVKAPKPKAEKKAPKVEDLRDDYATAESFPDTLKMGEAEYAIAHDITDMEKLLEAVNNDEDIVFAFYWSKRHLVQGNYAMGRLKHPKSFADNLDLATCLYVSDNKTVTYALSMYTEALYMVMADSFEEIDGMRFCLGIEFQIYRAVTK